MKGHNGPISKPDVNSGVVSRQKKGSLPKSSSSGISEKGEERKKKGNLRESRINISLQGGKRTTKGL